MPALGSTAVVTTPQAEQEWNGAQLAQRVTQPCVRLWTYRSPGVVFGCSQRTLLAQSPLGQAAALRGSGGGAVLTGPWMLSASIVLPLDHSLLRCSTVESYHWLGALHARLLRSMGIHAYAIPPEEVRLHPSSTILGWACYGGLSPWEVVVGKRKIVGLAQLRRRTGVLLTSGTLIAPPNWELLCETAGQPVDHTHLLARCTTSCEEELGMPASVDVLADRLHRMLINAVAVPVSTPLVPQAVVLP